MTSDDDTVNATCVSVPEELRKVDNTIRVGAALLLFSGTRRAPTSLQSCLEAYGYTVDAFDSIDGADGDLADDAVWDPLLAKVRQGVYIAAVISPPCTTFSRLRNAPGGPPPLRGTDGRERYGLTGLDKGQSELVRLHNLLALRGI